MMTFKEVATAAQADTARAPARGYSIPAGDRPCTMHTISKTMPFVTLVAAVQAHRTRSSTPATRRRQR